MTICECFDALFKAGKMIKADKANIVAVNYMKLAISKSLRNGLNPPLIFQAMGLKYNLIYDLQLEPLYLKALKSIDR